MSTAMSKEIREISEVIIKQGESNAPLLIRFAEFLKKESISNIVLLGRGSSRNACVYAKFLIESALNIPVSIASPSIASIYDRVLNYQNTLLFVCSQTGESSDQVKFIENAKKGGARIIGLINNESSSLAKQCDFLFSLKAGNEKNTATKSYIAMLYAFASLYAMFCGRNDLADELYHLPDVIDQVVNTKWDAFTETMVQSPNLFTLGRSFNLSTAREISLKCNEVCQIFSKAYTSPEFFHGPVALIQQNIPILHFLLNDESYKSSLETYQQLIDLGANVFTVDCKAINEKTLVLPKTSPIIEPIIQSVALFNVIENLSVMKGLNPDNPPPLSDLTKMI